MGTMFKTNNLILDGVQHGFMSREGGVSQGIYTSLNGAYGADDDFDNVTENRRLAVLAVGLGNRPLVTCAQVHSPRVVVVEKPWVPDQAPQADALVTRNGSMALAVLSADCTPVLFADANAKVVGAAHAGWKGAVDGVVEATLDAMIDLGACKHNIVAAIGPCIHQSSYEVGAELRESVLQQSDWAETCFGAGSKGHFQFDLPGYVRLRLERAGLGNIEQVDVDTYRQENRCFSYRRTTHQGGGDYGRGLSVIGLAPQAET